MDDIGPFTFNAVRFFVGFLAVVPLAFIFERKKFFESMNKGKKQFTNLAILIGLSLSGFYISGYLYQEPYPFTLLVFGFVACSFLLFPGISGSAFLLSVGAYPLIIGSISNFNLEVLFPFGIGMLIAVTIMPRFINKAYSKYGKSILVFFGGLIFAAGINNFL